MLLPQGVKNFVPSEAGGLKNAESELLDEYYKWGYRRVITPLFENLEAINAGLNDRLKSRVMKFVDPSTGDVVALRPDITPQICRIVATRLSHLKEPQRLCYSGRVVRFEHESSGRERELFQAGCELVGKKDFTADAEIMALAVNSLTRAGLSDLVLDIGHSGAVRAVERLAGKEKQAVKDALEMKSGRELARSLDASKMPASTRRKITALTQTRETNKALSLMDSVAELKNPAANIRSIVEVLGEYEIDCEISVDACDVRNFNYYTGVTFQILHPRAAAPLIVGGRYDSLIKRYGYNTPATGFAADVEGIVKTLSAEKKGKKETVHFVVIPTKPSLRKEAIRLSNWLRSNGFQVVAETKPRPPRKASFAMPPSYGVIAIDSPTKLRLIEANKKTTRRFSNLEELISGGI